MNKAFEKILERLDNYIEDAKSEGDFSYIKPFEIAKRAVQEVAEEYKDKPNIIDGLKIFLQEQFNYCAEQAEMNLEAECNSEIASYFRDRKELYLDRANIYGKVMREIDRLAREYNGGWIPCSERLPEEKDGVVLICDENGEVETGRYSEFSNQWYIGDMCAIGGSKVIAWQPLPQAYKEGE